MSWLALSNSSQLRVMVDVPSCSGNSEDHFVAVCSGRVLSIYIFVAMLFGMRFLFHYARWIWPLVEFRHPRSRAMAHKAAWSVIVLGIVASAAYDLAKMFLMRSP